MTEDKTKQVIVIRKDLKMGRGKEVSQGSHASMLFLVNRLNPGLFGLDNRVHGLFSDEEMDWLKKGRFTKITVSVDSEQEMLDLFDAAKAAGLTVHRVDDPGLTEFHGVKTLTAICIGPHRSSLIDPLTKDLKLL